MSEPTMSAADRQDEFWRQPTEVHVEQLSSRRYGPIQWLRNFLIEAHGSESRRVVVASAKRAGFSASAMDDARVALRLPSRVKPGAGAKEAVWWLPETGIGNEIPDVPVLADRGRKGVWQLTIEHCPFCARRHYHGGGSDDEPSCYGSRLSHCVTGVRQTYCLVPPEPDEAVPDRPQWLYRLFNSDGRLLYIGVSDSVWRRIKEHERDQDWGHDIAHVSRWRYPGRAAVLAAEKRAIAAEGPLYNIVHNRGDR